MGDHYAERSEEEKQTDALNDIRDNLEELNSHISAYLEHIAALAYAKTAMEAADAGYALRHHVFKKENT